MRNDDLAPLLADYFRSGAAREDMEATMDTYNMDLSQPNGPLDAYLHDEADARVKELEQRLQAACTAVEALQQEWFVAEEAGYGEAERDAYHAHHWQKLVEAVGAKAQVDEEWSDQDSRFITPALDLDAHNEQVLDTAYGPKETRS